MWTTAGEVSRKTRGRPDMFDRPPSGPGEQRMARNSGRDAVIVAAERRHQFDLMIVMRKLARDIQGVTNDARRRQVVYVDGDHRLSHMIGPATRHCPAVRLRR